jgi:DNA primase
MTDLPVGGADAALIPRVLTHYHLVASALEKSLGGSPLVYKNYPGGLDKNGHFGITAFPLTANRLLWAVHAKFAMEFYTWAPLPRDEDRLRFARLLLEPPEKSEVRFARGREAAQAIRRRLRREADLRAVPLVDGGNGIALWIPLADALRDDTSGRGCTPSATTRASRILT